MLTPDEPDSWAYVYSNWSTLSRKITNGGSGIVIGRSPRGQAPAHVVIFGAGGVVGASAVHRLPWGWELG